MTPAALGQASARHLSPQRSASRAINGPRRSPGPPVACNPGNYVPGCHQDHESNPDHFHQCFARRAGDSCAAPRQHAVQCRADTAAQEGLRARSHDGACGLTTVVPVGRWWTYTSRTAAASWRSWMHSWPRRRSLTTTPWTSWCAAHRDRHCVNAAQMQFSCYRAPKAAQDTRMYCQTGADHL